ncbi:MAG: hypothetical protein GF310_14250 [candidate division Zixibacteria bacterium]|nr:hypothetical protein [candidate division Zixibacteria bacterium]
MRGVIGLIIGLIIIFHPFAFGQDQAKISFTEDELEQIDAVNCFGFKFFRTFCKLDTADNIVVSPLSMHYALGMTSNFFSSGEIGDSIRRVACTQGTELSGGNKSYKGLSKKLPEFDNNVTIEISNSTWMEPQVSLPATAEKALSEDFNCDMIKANFQDPSTRIRINEYVSNKTHGKIKNAIDQPIPISAFMYFINTIYFNAKWTQPFEPGYSMTGRFNVSDEEIIDCEMMNQENIYNYFMEENFRGIEIPYGNGQFSLYVFVPSYPNDLKNLTQHFNSDSLSAWISKMQTDSIELYLPKLKVLFGRDVKDVLSALGMSKAFDMGLGVYIGQVLHKNYFQMDEKGTIAAAFSSVRFDYVLMPVQTPKFYVDRPFLFVIRENSTGAILFIGKIKRPIWEEG